ncbi:MAG: 2-oxoacid:acceptor oxidoreductase family protein [Bacteroidota bacterium]
MNETVLFAGFGGQGVVLMGKLIALAGMHEGREVTWLPSYGPEMRGGTASCVVVVSEERIGSPIIDQPHSAVIMNNPSLTKYEPTVEAKGHLLVNSSLVDLQPQRKDLTVLKVPCNEIADELGNPKVANMVMLGAYVGLTKAVKMESLKEALEHTLPPHRHNLLPLNFEAMERGAKLVEEQLAVR